MKQYIDIYFEKDFEKYFVKDFAKYFQKDFAKHWNISSQNICVFF